MKKLWVLITIVFCIVRINAQTLNIHFKNGTKIEFHKDLVHHVDFSEKPTEPSFNSGEAVDLGLSVMWASCNVGAINPDDAGAYYAWGEISEKEFYKEENYAYYNSMTTEYLGLGNISGTVYDAAYMNLGKGWQMPTYEQLDELEKKCTWKWTQQNGVNGYLVTGPSNNSIFLPASGYKASMGNILNYNSKGYYWCGKEFRTIGADHFYMSSDKHTVHNLLAQPKYYGLPIRPVISYDDYSGNADYDDTPVTSMISSYYAGGSVLQNGDVILSGSKLNFYFVNGSSKEVTLIGIQLIDGRTKKEGQNLLSQEVKVAAGESSGYTITVGIAGTESPICRFTYRYNHHTYTTEAEYWSFDFVKGETTELFEE